MAVSLASKEAVEEFDEPGWYTVVHDRTFVSTDVAVPADEDIFGVLCEGSKVKVLEVVRRDQDKRVRGRIESPAGWISLLDTENGYRWAVGMRSVGSRKAPSYHSWDPSNSDEVSNLFNSLDFQLRNDTTAAVLKEEHPEASRTPRTPRTSIVLKPATNEHVGTICRKPRPKAAAR
eukprot:TRINITY_DN2885_c0_g1_i1.p1 TRINITY_DN2885_c0_g1~~TRINITY_DN2885_c0_g1_i1.p1  ORF type:complete len:176 (+),score=32.59 TRINITY_DN2885_c0_g1_i1:343-870(+)